MSVVDDFAKGIIADSALSTALTKPLANANAAMKLTVEAAQAWQITLASFEAVLAEYGVKIDPGSTK